MSTMATLDGLDVVVSWALPRTPTDAENIVRSVRHGLADVLAWLGEDVGPKPGEQAHVLMVGRQLFVSQELFDKLKTREGEADG